MSLKEQIKHEIEQLVDPSTNKTLGEQNSLRHLVVDEEDSIVTAIIAIGLTKGPEEKTKHFFFLPPSPSFLVRQLCPRLPLLFYTHLSILL